MIFPATTFIFWRISIRLIKQIGNWDILGGHASNYKSGRIKAVVQLEISLKSVDLGG